MLGTKFQYDFNLISSTKYLVYFKNPSLSFLPSPRRCSSAGRASESSQSGATLLTDVVSILETPLRRGIGVRKIRR